MYYAMRHQPQVASLVLVNPVAASTALQQRATARLQARLTPEDSLQRAQLFSTPAFQNREPDALKAFYQLTFRPSFFDPSKVQHLNLWFDDQFAAKSSMLGLLDRDAAFVTYDLHPLLDQIQVPVLIVFGVHDTISEADLDPMLQALPDARLVRMDSSGHFPFIERPEAFDRHVRHFLYEIDSNR